MPDLQDVEQRFWAKVWRCTHRHPCKKCCWPWKACDLSIPWRFLWARHFSTCLSSEDGRQLQGPAHRIAYELHYGPVPFYGHRFHFCHQCAFAPCVNYMHIKPGAPSDNLRDTQRTQVKGRPIILLPDGRTWDYREAYDDQCYKEALEFKRIWAGPIPSHRDRHFWPWSLDDTPTKDNWPGRWPARTMVIRHEILVEEVESIQKKLKALAQEHDISLAFLCYLAQRNA